MLVLPRLALRALLTYRTAATGTTTVSTRTMELLLPILEHKESRLSKQPQRSTQRNGPKRHPKQTLLHRHQSLPNALPASEKARDLHAVLRLPRKRDHAVLPTRTNLSLVTYPFLSRGTTSTDPDLPCTVAYPFLLPFPQRYSYLPLRFSWRYSSPGDHFSAIRKYVDVAKVP